MLNNSYYISGITDYYNKSTTPISLNFASIGLSSDVHDKIEKVKWNLGEYHSSQIYTDVMYGYERTGTNKWPGKIALINPSDYGYSADLKNCKATLFEYDSTACTGTNWIYNSTNSNWTLIPCSSDDIWAFFGIESTGVLNETFNDKYGVRPVLYLKSDVSIVEKKTTIEGLKYFVVE